MIKPSKFPGDVIDTSAETQSLTGGQQWLCLSIWNKTFLGYLDHTNSIIMYDTNRYRSGWYNRYIGWTLSRNRPPRLTRDHYPSMLQVLGFEKAVERNRLSEHHEGGGAPVMPFSVSVLAEILLNSRNFGKSLRINRNIRLFERAFRSGNRRIWKSPETLSLS